MGVDTTQLQIWLDLARDGDALAHQQLISATGERLKKLAGKWLKDDRLLKFEELDDVLQQALARLHISLQESHPATIREFLGRAGLQLRRSMIDLARHYFGPHGDGRRQYHPHGEGPTASSLLRALPADDPSPSQAAREAETYERLYAAVDNLPEAWRELFDLLHLHGLSQRAAADILGLSPSTVERTWNRIKKFLHDELGGQLP